MTHGSPHTSPGAESEPNRPQPSPAAQPDPKSPTAGPNPAAPDHPQTQAPESPPQPPAHTPVGPDAPHTPQHTAAMANAPDAAADAVSPAADAVSAASAASADSFHSTSATALPPRPSTLPDVGGSAPEPTNAQSLIEARQSECSTSFRAKNPAQQSAIANGRNSIQKTFDNIKSTIGHMPAELLGSEPIDWDFWSRVTSDYNGVVEENPQLLLMTVARGIPREFRGIVWQLVAQSKNLELEELYQQMKHEPSVHERAIKRDLTRTSFFANVDAVKKADELFNVIKAYASFDPDVGYTQGMAFIAVPLVMNMTEAECFALLVTLMKDYGVRDLFCPDMHGLHLLLHQFDRVLESQSPQLYNHLVRQGIRSSMYASQWFLTFFSYKFPLDVVLRIFDMVITQGVEVIVQLAVNLMVQNEHSLLSLKFDQLLDFLKLNLFNIYVNDDFVEGSDKHESRRFSLLARKSPHDAAPKNYYKLDAFVTDALQIPVLPADLVRYKQEFASLRARDAARVADIEHYRHANGVLRHDIKLAESQYYSLSQSHIGVVQQLVDTKILLPDVRNDIYELSTVVAELQADIHALEAKLETSPKGITDDTETRIQELLAENAKETERMAALEEKVNALTIEESRLAAELKSRGQKWFW